MVKIRRISAEDIHGIKECNRRNLIENYHYLFLMYVISTAEGSCYLAENSKREVVAYCISKAKDSLEEKEKKRELPCGYVTSLAVDEAYRGRGIGKMLLSLSLYGLGVLLRRRTGSREYMVCLNVRESNNKAISLYKRDFGFEEEEIEKEYYPDKENAILMTRVFTVYGHTRE
ncbi:N-alpha-acetyltransferase 10/11 [Nematocida sp. LUAm3]|nr:N-alpha-acetyltransferase 10/11 [Nematocida sp. LUAm3]KAI5173570.1 N-alpha-acetyltransferase 10/11 [Nematocida sp. LUAm2]KAI5176791.1 N-alpha-acetyltransferase 10/11 [Nematocida sp. LUAm1]